MYYRNPDNIDLDRLTKTVRPVPNLEPMSLSSRLFLSVGMITAPVVTFFLILGVSRVIAAL
jgi:hypothetical protein